MSDIVERLRQGVDPDNIPETEQAMDAAAVEIERLQKLADDRREVANKEIVALMKACDTKDDEIERLRAEAKGALSMRIELQRLRAELAAERERCVRVAESMSPLDWTPDGMRTAIAAAIRRGDK